MPVHSLSEIVKMLGTVPGKDFHDREIRELLTDSRKVVSPSEALFFAIKGPYQDGHLFLQDAYDKGVRAFVVEEKQPLPAWKDAVFLPVSSSVAALQLIAAKHREKYQIPVVGITGSNGKTIVKDWLWQILSVDRKVCRSPKSYNSQIGVPLSVWQLDDSDQAAVFEAGISQPGEMEKLEPVIAPTIGVFTNIGTAHAANFESSKEKAREKSLLFRKAEKIIYCADYKEITALLKNHPAELVSWSRTGKPAHYQVDVLGKGLIRLSGPKLDISVPLPFSDDSSLENAVHVFFAAWKAGLEPVEIARRMAYLHRVGLRLEMISGNDGCIIVNDAYSADPESLKIAIDSLAQVAAGRTKTLIVSDMEQTGMEPEKLYGYVAGLIREKKISRVIAVGPQIGAFPSLFPDETLFFKDTESFLAKVHTIGWKNEVILVKGARRFRFERIVKALEEKTHQTVLEINLDGLVNNLNYYRSRVPGHVKWMAMVKASSYGTGGYEVANILQYFRLDYLGVAIADEGIQLRKNGITLPILVLNPVLERLDKFLEFDLEMEVYSMKSLARALSALAEYGKAPGVHIKIDTGMKRLGFDWDQLEGLLEMLSKNPMLEVKSVFSHLASADNREHNEFTREQIRRFTEAAEKIEKATGKKTVKHILNSGGISHFPEAAMDMVRLGVGLYGVGASAEEQIQLEPVASLKSVISQVRRVKPGESIGYGRSFVAEKEMVIAVVPVGYADGLRRSLSNGKGRMYVNGKPAPITGKVCMDMTMIDITGIRAEEGDEVEIFGQHLSLHEFAKLIDTIPYEVLTSLPTRVKRKYTWGNT